ncbi:MAG TPA: T9SS type A sorting domain-containing protein, partial [Bacteroidales bacterium]|nr:T9SS type A sorting domain-containing protein [Bacteroidales bacterium]
TSGNLSTGDKVKVTSGDGVLEVYYDILLGSSSARDAEVSNFVLYPNPTTGLLNISGLYPGNRILLYNTHGQLISITEAQNYNETISVENVPVGLYLIIISDENRILGRFKAVKK